MKRDAPNDQTLEKTVPLATHDKQIGAEAVDGVVKHVVRVAGKHVRVRLVTFGFQAMDQLFALYGDLRLHPGIEILADLRKPSLHFLLKPAFHMNGCNDVNRRDARGSPRQKPVDALLGVRRVIGSEDDGERFSWLEIPGQKDWSLAAEG